MKKRAANQSGDQNDPVTWRDLSLELKAFRLEMRLLIVIGLFATRLHLPDTVTVGSVAAVIGVGAAKSFLARS